MAMRLMLDELEGVSHRLSEIHWIISPHRQATAFLRSIGRKGRDNSVTTRFHSAAEAIEIGVAVTRLDQEMKSGTVVPDVKGLRWLPGGDVSSNPLHGSASIAQSLPGGVKRG